MNATFPVPNQRMSRDAGSLPLSVWSIVTSLTSGGAEMLVMNLNAAYAARRVDHTVVTLCDAATLGNSVTMERRMGGRIHRAGGRAVSLALGHRRGTLAGSRALRKLLHRGAPDVIHCHTVRALPMLGLAGYHGAVVATHHNSRLSFPPAGFHLFDMITDHYVAIADETLEHYRRHSRRPSSYIANAVGSDFTGAPPRTAVRRPGTVVSVGALSDQKNYGLLLETAQALKTLLPGDAMPRFVIAGGGDKLVELRERARQMGLAGCVEFLGEWHDIPQLLNAADIFLNTSIYEGQPIAMLEAFAMGLPVVATDVPGTRDLIRNGEDGLLAPLDSPSQLAAALARLAQESDFYAQLSAGARASGERFSIETTATQHLDLYQGLVRARGN